MVAAPHLMSPPSASSKAGTQAEVESLSIFLGLCANANSTPQVNRKGRGRSHPDITPGEEICGAHRLAGRLDTLADPLVGTPHSTWAQALSGKGLGAVRSPATRVIG